MGALLYALAMLAGFVAVAALVWWIGPKEPTDEDDQSDNQW